jgi:signal transduction histidine kinase
MKLRLRVSILLTLLLCVLGAVAVCIEETVVMPRFTQLELRNAHVAMSRVRNLVDHDLATLEVQVMDWGNWGELYEYARGNAPGFPAHNVTRAALREIQVTAIWIIGRDGRVRMFSGDYVHTGLDPEGLISRDGVMRTDLSWHDNLGTMKTGSGLLRTNLGMMLLVSGPILDGSGSGEPQGMAVMGRVLTPAKIRSMERETETGILAVEPENLQEDRYVETAGVTQVYGSFNDLYGKPVFTLRVDVPRDVTAQGRRAVAVASLSIVGVSIVVLLLILVFLNRIVLSPLDRVTRHAVAIGKDPDLPDRLNFTSSDEFGQLGAEFDRMVDSFAETRSQLVDQSFQAGFAEMSKGVLHNLGNALTPLGVRLEALSRRLRDAPAADMRLAAAELASAGDDPARRAALLEFIALGAAEIEAMIEGAAGDVETMQRQASLMRASLSEQARVSNSKAALVESVRLPELVQQSLEIVPDASRRRLAVEADESLQRVGTVRIARTVLRMVLQNLIINAADAVRESGKDKGVFRVAAEIVREAGRDALHLRCEDDGVGIPQDKLERVFEKGYSTKSRDTNQGIGLHWCANAILSLGGRIWAASEGTGRGAAMHLVLPLEMR